jgi:hypothetical protein
VKEQRDAAQRGKQTKEVKTKEGRGREEREGGNAKKMRPHERQSDERLHSEKKSKKEGLVWFVFGISVIDN